MTEVDCLTPMRDMAAALEYVRTVQAPVETGRYVPASLFTDRYRLGSRAKINRLPDLFLIEHGFIAVSERFKTAVEAFDIGDTHFPPLTILEKDRKTPIPGRYFYLNVCPPKPTVDIEASGKAFFNPSGSEWLAGDAYIDHIVVNKSALEGADLWMDGQFRGKRLFFSDRLRRALEDAKIKTKGGRNVRFIPLTIRES